MDDLPPPVQVIHGSSSGGNSNSSDDDSLVDVKVKNPFKKFFDFIINFIKRNQSITVKIPLIGLLFVLPSLGIGYTWGVNAAFSKFFPDSSPVFRRAISVEGVVQKSSLGKYYLKSGDDYTWTLKPKNSTVNLADYVNKETTIKGNLTKEKSVIEVSDIISLDSPASAVTPQISPIPPIAPTSQVSLNPLNIPDLYAGLQWETNQKKLLIFTSGKRKIEQEGIYLESVQLSVFPQDFINYYLEGLKSAGFKETLNSINPEGITITYAKDDLFLTFGIKNIYQGSGNKKQLSGYKAFIEHN